MPATLREIRELVRNKIGGSIRSVVSLDPDLTDSLAQRQILSAKLYDADGGAKKYAGTFIWVGKYHDQRRARENGYRTLPYSVYTPPTSGTYALTFYGYGTTTPLAFNASTTTIKAAITAANAGLGSTTVTTSGANCVLALPDIIDTEISAGTMVSQGGVGALEVNRGFTRALRLGDEFETCSKLPFDDIDDIQGLNTLINMALHMMWFIDDTPITPIKNSRGIQTFLNLTGLDWLSSDKQIVAIFDPTYWELTSLFTPPLAGSYTLTAQMGATTYMTPSLSYTDTGATIQATLQALAVPNVTWTVTPTTLGTPYTIVMSNTRYAQPTLAVSAGTISNSVVMLETPTRSRHPWKFQFHGATPYIDNIFGVEGESLMLKGYIPAYAKVCRQASYGVVGSTWEMTTTGLYDDYDQVVPPADDIATFVYALCCDQLKIRNPEDTFWQRESKDAHRVAAGLKWYDFPYDDKPRGNYYGLAAGGFGSKGYWGNW